MTDERSNGLITRIAVLESQMQRQWADMQSLRREDIKSIENKVDKLREDLVEGQRGLSTSERIALASAFIALAGVVITLIILLSGGGP